MNNNKIEKKYIFDIFESCTDLHIIADVCIWLHIYIYKHNCFTIQICTDVMLVFGKYMKCDLQKVERFTYNVYG